jgi:hypothetical protein
MSQVIESDAECFGYFPQDKDSGVVFPVFKMCDVGEVQVGFFCQLLLGKTLLFPDFSNPSAQCLREVTPDFDSLGFR